MSSPNPWADPTTPTETGAPYYGPPPTAQPGPPAWGPYPYGPPGYGGAPNPYGWSPYAPSAWGPRPPGRPGQVIGSTVLAFVQAAAVLIASVYVWFFASLADLAATEAPGAYSPATVEALATEGTVLSLVQLASAVLLVVAGIVALNRRGRGAWLTLVAAHAVQVLLAAYWGIRLAVLLGDVPGATDQGAMASLALFFAAAPLVGAGLVLVGPGRRWFRDRAGTAPS